MNALWEPERLERLAALRIVLPIAILGFMAPRLAHAPHWIGRSGFSVPDLGRADYRQPLYLPPLPDPLAWLVAGLMVASGLALALGYRTRVSGLVFAASLFYVALADRLAAFTVSKLSGVIALTLALSAAGARWGVDAWRAARADPAAPRPTHGAAGELRVLQGLVIVLYTASGLCKGRGDWLVRDDILWTHLHDAYQTSFTHAFANLSSPWMWPAMQWSVFLFELFAPLWFGLAATRTPAVLYGVILHALIGLMFGPLVWFSLLMIGLLVGGFAPVGWLSWVLRRLPG